MMSIHNRNTRYIEFQSIASFQADRTPQIPLSNKDLLHTESEFIVCPCVCVCLCCAHWPQKMDVDRCRLYCLMISSNTHTQFGCKFCLQVCMDIQFSVCVCVCVRVLNHFHRTFLLRLVMNSNLFGQVVSKLSPFSLLSLSLFLILTLSSCWPVCPLEHVQARAVPVLSSLDCTFVVATDQLFAVCWIQFELFFCVYCACVCSFPVYTNKFRSQIENFLSKM